MRLLSILVCCAALLWSATPAAEVAGPLPADSVYHLNPDLQTAAGRTVSFAARGRVRIVTMFYATCPMACPLVIDTIRNLDAVLTPAERAQVDVLLLSMDPDQDTPAVLTALARERRITSPRWMLARSAPSDTRKLAALLGIQYRKVASGDFDHASVLILLDAQGRVLARSTKVGTPDPEFVARVRTAASRGTALP